MEHDISENLTTDTIAAISTSLSPSGIGIVRISGPRAFSVADAVFVPGNGAGTARAAGGSPDAPAADPAPVASPSAPLSAAAGYTLHYGHIRDEKGVVDEVLAGVLRAPHSFTAEDTVEFNCHGGPQVTRRVLELCLAHGARLAEPGEFTKRAFLNGRIDLAQAEAVGELIRSKNETARRASMAKLSGRASEDISGLRGEILYETAFIEAAMDDPEHISIEGCTERLLGELSGWQSRIQTVLDGSRRGRLLTDGIRTAIIGRPNVGKSSIMNLLLGEDRAIVTQVAGTTRDTLEEQMSWEGISLNIIDTAGIRETDDPVELIGVERARKALEEADLVLLVADASEGIGPEDRALEQTAAGRPAIAILNKTDLLPRADAAAFSWGSEENGGPVMFSAVNGTGLEELKDRIKEMFFAGTFSGIESSWLANARQTEALEAALESLEHVREAARAGLPEDMFTIDLSEAYRQLGLIIGEDVDEDLINKIFSDFCMGK